MMKGKSKKRMFSAVLALAMVLTLMPFNCMKAYADQLTNGSVITLTNTDICGTKGIIDDNTYTYKDGKLKVTLSVEGKIR